MHRALVNITQKIILELEQRRYIFRKKMEISRPSKKIENQLNGLYDYEPLKQSISVALKHSGMNKTTIEEVNKIIDKEQNKKNEAIEEIKKAVAVYQGQATLGKIVNIILHEGRRPLNYFKNQIPNLIFFGNEFMINRNEDDYNEIVKLTNGIADNSELFVKLFGRLDPLAAKKRDTKAKFNLSEEIKNAIDVFSHEIAQSGIRLEFKCDSQIEYTGWKQDIYTIIVNIIPIYKKGEANQEEIVTELCEISDTGLFSVISGVGIIEEAMTKIFWNNLYPQINIWKLKKSQGVDTEKVLLRYVVSHIQELIDTEVPAYETEEMYIKPPVTNEIRTGGIYTSKRDSMSCIVLSPPCDLAIRADGKPKTDRILVCEIDDNDSVVSIITSGIEKKDKKIKAIEKALKNNYSDYYHWLPRNDIYQGGYINFRKVITYSPEDFAKEFEKSEVKVQEFFVKSIPHYVLLDFPLITAIFLVMSLFINAAAGSRPVDFPFKIFVL